MLNRWFAGVVIFALGFGCARVMTPTSAEAKSADLEPGLKYMDNGTEYEVTNAGESAYLAVVDRKAGSEVVEPQLGLKTGTAVFTKKDLERLTIFRVTPVAFLDPSLTPSGRDCHPGFEDCPLPQPDPPPPFMFIAPDERLGS